MSTIAVNVLNFNRAESDLMFARLAAGAGLGHVEPHSRARVTRQPADHPPEPRHPVQQRDHRRARKHHDHGARYRQALHLRLGGQSRSFRSRHPARSGRAPAHTRIGRDRLRRTDRAYPRRSEQPRRRRRGEPVARRPHHRRRRNGRVPVARLRRTVADRDPRRAPRTRAWHHHLRPFIRHRGGSRPDQAPARYRIRLGWPSRVRGHLRQLRRTSPCRGIPSPTERCSRGRVLVGLAVQRSRILRRERLGRQQHQQPHSHPPTPTAAPPSGSASISTASRTHCPSCRAGTTYCACTAPAPTCSTAPGRRLVPRPSSKAFPTHTPLSGDST